MLISLQRMDTGEFLINSKDGVLTVQINSTLFNNQDDFLGSLTFPGTLPLEPNRKNIRNAHYILTDAGLRSFMVRCYIGALPYKIGRLVFTVENNTINYNLYIDTGNIAQKLANDTLTNLLDPANDVTLTFSSIADYQAYMLSTTTAAPGAMPMVFFPYKNVGAYKVIDPDNYATYPKLGLPWNPYFNAWQFDDDHNGSFILDAIDPPFSNTQTPFFYLVYILKRIALYYGFQPVGKWLTEVDANRIVIASMIPVTVFLNDPDVFIRIDDWRLYVPDIPVADFLKEVRSNYGLLIDFDEINSVATFESLVNLQRTAGVTDLRAKQTTNYRETGTNPDVFTITQGVDDKDAAFSDTDKNNLPVLTIGDPATAVQTTDVELISVVTQMSVEVSPAAAAASNWRIPYMSQPIQGQGYLNDITVDPTANFRDFKLRFLIWQGMQRNEAGLLYPYGSFDNLDRDLLPLGDFTLALNPSGTAFQSLQHYYQYIKNSKPFELDCQLTPQEIVSLKVYQRILVKDFNQVTVSCIMDSYSADLANKDLIDTKLTLYPDISPVNDHEIAPPPVVPPPYDNGVVFARLDLRNQTSDVEEHPEHAFVRRQDGFIVFFADAEASVPKNVINLVVRLRTALTVDGTFQSYSYVNINCNSILNADTGNYEFQIFNQQIYDYEPIGHTQFYHYNLEIADAYTIIPS